MLTKKGMKEPEIALREYGALVITGGSSGIGKALLENALSIKTPLIIANLSRSEPDSRTPVGNFKHIRTDLRNSEAIEEAYQELDAWIGENAPDRPLLLINNSGVGCYGPFPEPSLEDNLSMIDVNVRAVVQLTGLLLPRIRETRGGVVNIASTAAFQPLGYMGTYAATKAFLLSWGLALNEELRSSGAFCNTLCPGPTSTEFFNRAGFEGDFKVAHGQDPDAVARATFQAIASRSSLKTSGFFNWMLAGISGTLPRRWIAPLATQLIKGLRLEQYRKS